MKGWMLELKDNCGNERMKVGMKGWMWEWKDKCGNERMNAGIERMKE